MITVGETWVGLCKCHASSRLRVLRARVGFGSDFWRQHRARAFSCGSFKYFKAMGLLSPFRFQLNRRWNAYPELRFSSLHTRRHTRMHPSKADLLKKIDSAISQW